MVNVSIPYWVEQGYPSQQAYNDRNKPKVNSPLINPTMPAIDTSTMTGANNLKKFQTT